MNPESFDDLCLRALEGEAEAQTEIDRLIQQDPALAAQWQRLQAELHEAGQFMIDAQAAQTTPVEEPIPDEQLDRLLLPVETSDRLKRSRRRSFFWLGGLGIAAAATLALTIFSGPRASPELTVNLAALPPRAQENFFTPALAQLTAGTRLITWRAGTAPAIISPRVATAWQQPAITWETKPGLTYTVTLREVDSAALARVEAVRPPVELHQLKPALVLSPDRQYEITITPTGANDEQTAHASFVTAPRLTAKPAVNDDAQATLAFLQDAMREKTPRLGDALALWEKLPRNWRASESGVRTGFWLAEEAQLPGLLAEVQADAEKLNRK